MTSARPATPAKVHMTHVQKTAAQLAQRALMQSASNVWFRIWYRKPPLANSVEKPILP
jgi:hypothetical protein